MAFKLVAAQAALDTEEEWQRAIEVSIEDPRDGDGYAVIERRVFERWVRLKGRKIGDESAVC